MSERRLPRRGGAAHSALMTLHALGGRAVFSAWYQASATAMSVEEFNSRVAKVLARHKLIEDGIGCAITPAGLRLLGIAPPTQLEIPVELVPPRTLPPFRPLQRRSTSAIVYREGAFDYRDSPSIMGGQRVPFRTQT